MTSSLGPLSETLSRCRRNKTICNLYDKDFHISAESSLGPSLPFPPPTLFFFLSASNHIRFVAMQHKGFPWQENIFVL